MIQQKPKPDLNTLLQLAERKSEYLTIRRTPTHWFVVGGKNPEADPVGYESLSDALMNFIMEGVNNDDGGQ